MRACGKGGLDCLQIGANGAGTLWLAAKQASCKIGLLVAMSPPFAPGPVTRPQGARAEPAGTRLRRTCSDIHPR